MHRPALLWIVGLMLTVAAIAQSPDIPEPGSIDAIAKATTDPSYVSLNPILCRLQRTSSSESSARPENSGEPKNLYLRARLSGGKPSSSRFSRLGIAKRVAKS
jgi:hypothetical protein